MSLEKESDMAGFSIWLRGEEGLKGQVCSRRQPVRLSGVLNWESGNGDGEEMDTREVKSPDSTWPQT